MRFINSRATLLRGMVCLAVPLMLAPRLAAFAQEAPPNGIAPPPPPGLEGPWPHHEGPGGPHEHGGPHGPGPLGELARAEADQAAAQTIVALTSAKLEEVQRIIRAWDVPTALRYFNVTPAAFRDAIQPRLVALVKQAAQDQRISAADADRLVGDLQRPAPPR